MMNEIAVTEDENSDGYPVFRNESMIPLLSILGSLLDEKIQEI